MTRVLLGLALALLAAAGDSAVAVSAPVPGSAGLLPQQGRPRPTQTRTPDPGRCDRCAGDLEDGQESLDPGPPRAAGSPGPGPVRRRPPHRPLAPACHKLLFAAPKTGPPTLPTPER